MLRSEPLLFRLCPGIAIEAHKFLHPEGLGVLGFLFLRRPLHPD